MAQVIISDFHTHTRYSDGKSKLCDMVEAGIGKGLKQMGTSDHGLKHLAFGLRQPDIFKLRAEVDKLCEQYNFDLKMGIEANIYSAEGNIDLRGRNRDYFDFIIAGYHKCMAPQSLKDAINYNFVWMYRKNFSKSQIDGFTKAYINTIKHQGVNIISHLTYCVPVDVKQVGQAAKDYNVYIELNGKNVRMSDEEILTLYDMQVPIIVNSDAHSADRVGDFSHPMSVVERLNLDKNRIANFDKLVTFEKRR